MDQLLHARAEGGAIGELVVRRRGDTDRGGVADEPRRPCRRLGSRHLGKGDQGVRRRVAGADDDGVLSRERRPLGAEHVGKRMVHEIGDIGEAERIQPGRSERVRRRVGAGRIDHRAARQFLDDPLGGPHAEQERRSSAAGGAGAVHPLPRHGDRARAEPYARPDLRQCGEGLQECVDEFVAGGRSALIGRHRPAGRFEQTSGSRIDDVPPRREQSRVAPESNGCGDAIAGLDDDEVPAPLGEIRCCGEPDRAGPDDDHRQRRPRIVRLDSRRQFEQRHGGLHGISMSIDAQYDVGYRNLSIFTTIDIWSRCSRSPMSRRARHAARP